jgi:hypothetical protein
MKNITRLNLLKKLNLPEKAKTSSVNQGKTHLLKTLWHRTSLLTSLRMIYWSKLTSFGRTQKTNKRDWGRSGLTSRERTLWEVLKLGLVRSKTN